MEATLDEIVVTANDKKMTLGTKETLTDVLVPRCGEEDVRFNQIFGEKDDWEQDLESDKKIQDPHVLRMRLGMIEKKLIDLSVDNYDVFVGKLSSESFVRIESDNCRILANSLETEVDELSLGLTKLIDSGSMLLNDFSSNKRTLEMHAHLLTLLEIPRLMETCFSNELYSEALDLCSYTISAEKRHIAASRGSVPDANSRNGRAVVHGIFDKVRSLSGDLRSKVLDQLSRKLSLSNCLRYVGYLRQVNRIAVRLGEVTSEIWTSDLEFLLRLQFLKCRETYLSSLLVPDLNATNPFRSAQNFIENWRTAFLDVICQYNTLFIDVDKDLALETDQDIIGRWIWNQMANFAAGIEAFVDQVDDFQHLRILLEDTFNFSSHMSDLGANFSELLLESFRHKVLNVMLHDWELATCQLVSAISGGELCWGSPLPIPQNLENRENKGNESLEEEVDDLELPSDVKITSSDHLRPPLAILEFPILAKFSNALVSSFNKLRQCPIATLAGRLKTALRSSLDDVSNALVKFKHAAKLQTDDSPQNVRLQNRIELICKVWTDEVVPYALRCFNEIFDIDIYEDATAVGPVNFYSEKLRGVSKPEIST